VTYTHLPTDIKATVTANRVKDLPDAAVLAKKLLTSRVWARGQARPSGQIRTYTFYPYRAVKDHRSGRQLDTDPMEFLSGNIEPLTRLAESVFDLGKAEDRIRHLELER